MPGVPRWLTAAYQSGGEAVEQRRNGMTKEDKEDIVAFHPTATSWSELSDDEVSAILRAWKKGKKDYKDGR